MIQITLKAKHYYYIVKFLKNYSLEQYFDLFSRIKNALQNNVDNEAEFSVNASLGEIINIYKILTVLPEGQANVINSEMSDMLQTQIQAGAIQEITNGIVADENGSLPENAYWQSLGAALTGYKNENAAIRDADINTGKQLIEGL